MVKLEPQQFIRLLNLICRHDPECAQQLRPLLGKHVRVDIQPVVAFTMRVAEEGFEEVEECDAHFTIRGTALAFLRMITSGGQDTYGIHFSGEGNVMQKFQQVMVASSCDVFAVLSDIFGATAASVILPVIQGSQQVGQRMDRYLDDVFVQYGHHQQISLQEVQGLKAEIKCLDERISKIEQVVDGEA